MYQKILCAMKKNEAGNRDKEHWNRGQGMLVKYWGKNIPRKNGRSGNKNFRKIYMCPLIKICYLESHKINLTYL